MDSHSLRRNLAFMNSQEKPKPKIIDNVNDKVNCLLNKADGTLNLLDDILLSLKEIKESIDRIDKDIVVVDKPKSWFF